MPTDRQLPAKIGGWHRSTRWPEAAIR